MRLLRLWGRVVCVGSLAAGSLVAAAAGPSWASAANRALGVNWMRGYAAPGTPLAYDKVGLIKVGSPHSKERGHLDPSPWWRRGIRPPGGAVAPTVGVESAQP